MHSPVIIMKDLHKIKSECYPHTSPYFRVPSGRFPAGSRKSSQLISHTYQNTALRTARFWIITQRVVIICYRRFGTTYRSHLQGSRILIRLEKQSSPNKCHREQDSLRVRYPKAGRKPKIHVQITVFKYFLLSERREYKLWLWRI